MAETQAITKAPPSVAMTKHGFSPTTLDEAYRFSQWLAKSNLVPDSYHDKPENCLIALDLASRLNTHWLAIMQHVYIVHGRPGLDANLSIGLVNQSGQFEPIQYEEEGVDATKQGYRVRAYSKRVGSPIVLYGPWIDWSLVKAEKWDSKDGSKWKSMPDQMFHYRAGSWWQKRHCPEMTLGMPTTDELSDAGPSTKYVESTSLEPTQGRAKFGFDKKGEQPPEVPPGDQPPAEEPEKAEKVFGSVSSKAASDDPPPGEPLAGSPAPLDFSPPTAEDARRAMADSPEEETKARLCPKCATLRTGKFYRLDGRLVCLGCLRKATGAASAPIRYQWVCVKNNQHVSAVEVEKCPQCYAAVKRLEIRF